MASDSKSIPPPPRPADHPAELPWPPQLPEYHPQHVARLNKESNHAFHKQEAVSSFGLAFVEAVNSRHQEFAGDLWLLAMLERCKESAVATDPHGTDPNRFVWWRNTIVQPLMLQGVRPHLEHARFLDADLRYVYLTEARLDHAVLAGSLLDHAFLYAAHLDEAVLAGASFRRAMLGSSYLLGASCEETDFRRAWLGMSRLRGAYLYRADFRHAELGRSDLSKVRCAYARFRAARGLFGKNRALTRSEPVDEYESQNATYRWEWTGGGSWTVWARTFGRAVLKDHISWELLRIIGGLRLFGVSYISVAAITFYAALARRYNIAATHAREVATGMAEPESTLAGFWSRILARLPDMPLPAHLGWQLTATVAVAMAATIYAVRCPAEVKEANEVGWTRAMGQPLWEYRSANWSRCLARYLCALLFAAGGIYSAGYLGVHCYRAVKYLIFHS